MMKTQDFVRLFGSPLEGAGYVRRAKTWYRRGTDTVFVVDLQKSDWANSYHINLALWIRRLGEADFPKENKCHIQTRALSYFRDIREQLDKVCSLDEDMEDSERGSLVRDSVVPRIIDLGNASDTLNGLRQLHSDGAFAKALVFKEAKDLLAG